MDHKWTSLDWNVDWKVAFKNCSRFQQQPVESVSVMCLFVLQPSIVFVVYSMTLLFIQSFVGWMGKKTKGCLFFVRARIVIFQYLLHILNKPWWCAVRRWWGLKWLPCCRRRCRWTSCSQRRPFESKKFIVNHGLLSKWNGKVQHWEWDGRQRDKEGRNKDLRFSGLWQKKKRRMFLSVPLLRQNESVDGGRQTKDEGEPRG